MRTILLAAGLATLVGVPAVGAADLYVPEPAPYVEPAPVVQASGWYLRGDVGYAFNDMRGAYYFPGGNYDEFDTADLDDNFTIGIGVGYQVTNHFRVDFTGDYGFSADFHGSTSTTGCGATVCGSSDSGSAELLSLLANAYVDLGTWNRVTPYIGAGIGGTYINWDEFDSVGTPGCTSCGGDYDGRSDWRFTWALMAGASVDLTCNLKLDAGYRFRHVDGGGVSDDISGAGRVFDDGLDIHEVRGGLRYTFGGCAQPPVYASYEPMPVYK